MDDRTLTRFLAKVETDDNGCWIWHGWRTWSGYGMFGAGDVVPGSTTRLAHRISYIHYIGPIPDGLTIDHLCRVRPCCNPSHMEPVTQAENTRRGMHPSGLSHWNGRKKSCKHGHPFTPENTIYSRQRNGTSGPMRMCRECAREYQRNRRRRARADRESLRGS